MGAVRRACTWLACLCVQVVLDNVYNLELAQLILLALEGVGFTLALTAWCWVMLARMDQRRFSMFFIFMVSRQGVVAAP